MNNKESKEKENGKDFKDGNLEEEMVKVRVWVPGYYYYRNGRRVHVKGYHKIIDVPRWRRSSFGRR